MDEKTKSTRSLTLTVSFGPSSFIKPPMVRKSLAEVPASTTFSETTKVLDLTSIITSNLASKKIIGNFDESKIGSSKANLSAISAPLSTPECMYLVDGEEMIAGGIFFTAPPPSMALPKTRKISELTSKITVQCETGPDFGESKTDSIEAMLSHISAPPGLLSPRPYADCFVKVEGSVGWCGGGLDGVVIGPKELTAPVEFGSSQVRVSVERRGENSSGSGAENAGEERNRSRRGGGNEGIGGGRQGSRNEGRQGGLGAGGHGGGNGDDDGNNNGRGRIGDIQSGRIPPRNPRQEEELVEIFIPIIIEIVVIAFSLDEANVSALDPVLRSFALACCVWVVVSSTGSLWERGRNERMARDLSIIASTLTNLALLSIIVIKLPPTLFLFFIIGLGLAILALLAIIHR